MVRKRRNSRPGDSSSTSGGADTGSGGGANGLRLLKPPYGRITAYDMSKGTIAWQIPNGDTPPNIKANLAAAGLTNVPPTGSPSQAGLLVTRNFLFAGEGADLRNRRVRIIKCDHIENLLWIT